MEFMAQLLAEKYVRDIPDFPKPGIIFKDIAPVLENPQAFREVVDLLTADAKSRQCEAIVGIESRGFIFGTPIAYNLGVPFVLARKVGKLPFERITEEYALEYGTNTVEMHVDSISKGTRCYLVDDLLATGGTAAAASKLVRRLEGEVIGFGCLIELTFLDGRANLSGVDVHSLIKY